MICFMYIYTHPTPPQSPTHTLTLTLTLTLQASNEMWLIPRLLKYLFMIYVCIITSTALHGSCRYMVLARYWFEGIKDLYCITTHRNREEARSTCVVWYMQIDFPEPFSFLLPLTPHIRALKDPFAFTLPHPGTRPNSLIKNLALDLL